MVQRVLGTETKDRHDQNRYTSPEHLCVCRASLLVRGRGSKEGPLSTPLILIATEPSHGYEWPLRKQ